METRLSDRLFEMPAVQRSTMTRFDLQKVTEALSALEVSIGQSPLEKYFKSMVGGGGGVEAFSASGNLLTQNVSEKNDNNIEQISDVL